MEESTPSSSSYGQAFFFWFSSLLSTTNVMYSEIFKYRVVFNDMIPYIKKSGNPVFIECCNLHKTPDQLKGVCVAYRHIDFQADLNSVFFFAIVYKIDYERDLMIAFKLNSPVQVHAFYDLSYNNLSESFLTHFHQVTVPLSTVHLYWLNKVSGKPLPLTFGYTKDITGPDGKFQNFSHSLRPLSPWLALNPDAGQNSCMSHARC